MAPLAGKVALVTGASKSIGAAIARRLAVDGASVAVNYVSDESGAQSVVEFINQIRPNAAVAIKADVSSVESAQTLVHKTIQHFGQLDIVVLNAGVMDSKVLSEVDEKSFDFLFNVNVKGPLFLVQAAAPHLPAGGRVIFISTSITRVSTVSPNNLVYAATKGAVEQFNRVLAKELGARGVTVNTVSPGPTDTPLFRQGKTEQQIQFFAGLSPQKRLPQPEEIAPAVAFLASPDASWVNGQNIPVNGGFTV